MTDEPTTPEQWADWAIQQWKDLKGKFSRKPKSAHIEAIRRAQEQIKLQMQERIELLNFQLKQAIHSREQTRREAIEECLEIMEDPRHESDYNEIRALLKKK